MVRHSVALSCGLAVAIFSHHGAAAGQQTGGNRSRHFGPGECGRVDSTYIRLANETGGQPFFLNPSEAAKALQFESSSNAETLAWATGALENAVPRDFAVPIDSSVRRATFTLSVDTWGSDFTVVDPSGAAIAAADANTEITVLNCGRIVTVNNPAVGTWKVRVTGLGTYWMTVHARTEVSFVSAEFVRRGGRPGHEGLFRIPGQPVAGAPATLRTVIGGAEFDDARFELVSLGGEPIAAITAEPVSAGEYVATFNLPPQPFRVRFRARDERGVACERVFHTLFHAETVDVAPANTVDELVPGRETPIAFVVRNTGPSPTGFRIVATDGRRYMTRYEPREVVLESGMARTVVVWLTVPGDAAPGTGVDVTLTATAPATSNGATVHCSVASRP